jgi:hypothetical protein
MPRDVSGQADWVGYNVSVGTPADEKSADADVRATTYGWRGPGRSPAGAGCATACAPRSPRRTGCAARCRSSWWSGAAPRWSRPTRP